MRILITGGGTSGHISPALAVIQAIRAKAEREKFAVELLYLGSNAGLEREIVTAARVPFIGIQTGKLRRYLSFENLIDQFRLPVGTIQGAHAIRRFRPEVLFSTGGYVSVPPVVAAALLRVPIIIHEQTVQIGLANRICSRFAERVALSFESARAELPAARQKKAIVTGNPIRSEIFGGDAGSAKKRFGFCKEDDQLPAVYITGGSQGARIINRAVEEVLPELLETYRIVHQCGRQPASQEQDFERLQSASKVLPERLRRRYFVAPFFRDELKDVFALCDLVVGRAGAGTVTELCALQKPAVYIPLVPTGGDEQTRNAQMCVEAGAAVIIKQKELGGERLARELKVLLSDKKRLKSMSEAASTLARLDSAELLAEEVLKLARKKR